MTYFYRRVDKFTWSGAFRSFMKRSIAGLFYKVISKLILTDIMEEIRYHRAFDEQLYLFRNPEVRSAGIDPLLHFLLYGRNDGRVAGQTFDLCFHIERNPAIRGGLAALLPWIFRRNRIFRRRNQAEIKLLLEQQLPAPTGLARRPVGHDLVNIHYQSPETNPTYEKEQVPFHGLASPRLIAFYLPQFHPFPENDRFWGRGFTEWANVTKALPLFSGHYQPKLPGELGFYDLRIPEIMHRQAEMAKQAGIYGFCFHHYYFEGKTVMRAPLDYLLDHRELDIPFCLHWANESWSAKFDGWGREGGMLIEQRHSAVHDILFLENIERALRDERYIRIHGKPVIAVYRPQLFPDAAETAARWRDHSLKMGLPGLYLIMAQTSFDPVTDPRTYGFDAAVEFPPHRVRHVSLIEQTKFFNNPFKGRLFNYPDVAAYSVTLKKPAYTLLRGIMPAWDNTARIREPYIYHNAAPEIYQEWLTGLLHWSKANNLPEEQYIFINAWNEWAEGAYLEPDRKYGFGWLNATARALNSVGKIAENGQ